MKPEPRNYNEGFRTGWDQALDEAARKFNESEKILLKAANSAIEPTLAKQYRITAQACINAAVIVKGLKMNAKG